MKKSQLLKIAQAYIGEDLDYNTTADMPMKTGPTIGTLEHAIMVDQRISAFEKKYALQKLQMDTGYAPPGTPLKNVLGMIGGGILGAIVARLVGLGGFGMGVAAIGGYSLGKVISDFYLNQSGSKLQVL